MTLAVEIYDERELNPLTLKTEPDDEALALIQELGLTAQVAADGVRIAYPKPTVDQQFVLNVLFPTQTTLNRYDAGGIPLRVLKEIRSYTAEHPNHALYVRHSPPAVIKDPVLVAYEATHSWEHTTQNCRMIARWGDGLESWDKLLDRASAIFSASYDTALSEIIAKAQQFRTMIAGGKHPRSADGNLPYIHIPASGKTTVTGENSPF